MRTGSEILQEFNATLPMTVLAARPYFGTFVCFNLIDANRQPVRLRAYMTDWEFKDGSETLTTSYGARDEWAEVACLDGDQLNELKLVNSDCLVLAFASGKSFVLNSNLVDYQSEDEMLTIYAPGRFGMGYSPKSGFRTNVPDE